MPAERRQLDTTVEVVTPQTAGGQTIRITAAPERAAADEPEGAEGAGVDLIATYRETDATGIYRVRLTDQNQIPEDRWLAYNVSPAESDLTLADAGALRKRVPKVTGLTIQEPGSLNWIEGREIGHEMRWLLLILLVTLLVCEQFLAYRFSYHPRVVRVAT